MLWYCRTRAPGSVREGARHRRRQREMEDRDVAAAGRVVGERPDVVAQVVVDGQREQVGGMALGPQQIADAAGAVADGVAPVGGRHPLVDDHGAAGAVCPLRSRPGAARRRRPGGIGAAPPAAGCDAKRSQKSKATARRRLRRHRPHLLDEAADQAAEVAGQQPRQRRVLRLDDLRLEIGIAHHGVDDRRDVRGILVGVEHAAAVHRRRDRRRRVGDDRQADVERLHQRHAEPLVLAGAQEQVGDLVVGGELGVRHVAEEVDVVRAEVRDQLLQHREVALEARPTSRPAAAATARCGAACRRGSAG